jgi:trigger factor
MKVQVEEVSPIERRLEIEVEPKVVQDELSRAYANLSRQVKIAGFRPGKIPRRILEQRFKDEVEPDVLRRVQMKAFLDAIVEHKVDAVSDPHISAGKLDLSAPYQFSVRVEVKPKIDKVDTAGVKLTDREVKIEDAKVDEQIEKMRSSRTELKAVEGRDTAKEGDFAMIDFIATHDGKDFPGNKGEGVTVEVLDGQLVDAHVKQLEGVKVGETKEFNYTFPEDYRVDDIKGKTALFKVTLKELKAKHVPVLDEAFATSLGMESVEKLKDRVRSDLSRAEKQKAVNDEREELFKALIDKNKFDVPKSMIDRGVEMMLENTLRSIQRGGVDPRQLGLDLDGFRNEFRPKAELEVRGQLLLEAVAAAQKIEVSDQDIETKLESLAAEAGAALSQVRKAFRGEDEKAGLKNRIREEKTIAFLKHQAK